MDLREKKTALKFFDQYLQYAERMRPDLAMIEDPVKREDEIYKWMNEMEEPDKLLMDFVSTNPLNLLGSAEDCRKKSKEDLKRIDEVKDLPTEDTIWMIEEFTCLKDESGQDHRILSIGDPKGYIIGTWMVNIIDVPLVQHCRELVCISAFQPMTGVPRKPSKVTFKEPLLADKAVGLDLTDMGIKYMYDGVKNDKVVDDIRMRECSVCRLRGTKELFKKCSSCQALLYCSKNCQKADWLRKGDMAPHSHKIWCKRMKNFMDKTEQMRDFPFTFAQETTCEDFDQTAYKKFLEGVGVLDQGLWRRECKQHGKDSHCYCSVPFGDLQEANDPIVLPVESTILDEAPKTPPPLLHDWESYYKYRGFRMDSPIAILLQWPLTLYHIVKYCYPNDNPEWWDSIDSSTMKIDIVGVEKEVEMLPLFKELGYLCPDVEFDIVMYGVEISKSIHNKTYEHGNIKIKIDRALYHRQSTERKAHFVVGLNAGLGAYRTWSQTLVKLRTDRTPAYFTDYCQYSCECARIAIEGLSLGTTSDPAINPFRNPVRKLAEENDMPWYSNGFLFHLVYPSK